MACTVPAVRLPGLEMPESLFPVVLWSISCAVGGPHCSSLVQVAVIGAGCRKDHVK